MRGYTRYYNVLDHVTSHTYYAPPTIMSLETARDLSILDLIRVLNEKIDVEWPRLLETPLPSVAFVASMESEVRAPWYIISGSVAESYHHPSRSNVLKQERAISGNLSPLCGTWCNPQTGCRRSSSLILPNIYC